MFTVLNGRGKSGVKESEREGGYVFFGLFESLTNVVYKVITSLFLDRFRLN